MLISEYLFLGYNRPSSCGGLFIHSAVTRVLSSIFVLAIYVLCNREMPARFMPVLFEYCRLPDISISYATFRPSSVHIQLTQPPTSSILQNSGSLGVWAPQHFLPGSLLPKALFEHLCISQSFHILCFWLVCHVPATLERRRSTQTFSLTETTHRSLVGIRSLAITQKT